MKVYLTVEGQERVALGRSLYSWDFVVREEGATPPERSCLVGTFEPVFPSPEDCIPPVLEKFKEKEAEIQAAAHSELMELQERRQNLLSLTYTEAS